MKKRFQYLKRDKTNSRLVSLPIVMSVAALRVVLGLGPFTLEVNGVAGPERDRTELLRRLRAQLKHGDIGDAYQVFKRGHQPVFRVREAKPPLVVINTNGNAKADYAWSLVKAAFPYVTFLGSYVCKLIIGGGGARSQHSYGNAVDIGARTMEELRSIFYFAIAHAEELNLEHAIVGDQVWTRGEGIHHYGGEYHYHVHLDFNPQYDGQCGVRGLPEAA